MWIANQSRHFRWIAMTSNRITVRELKHRNRIMSKCERKPSSSVMWVASSYQSFSYTHSFFFFQKDNKIHEMLAFSHFINFRLTVLHFIEFIWDKSCNKDKLRMRRVKSFLLPPALLFFFAILKFLHVTRILSCIWLRSII
jgi:hypothetical protein